MRRKRSSKFRKRKQTDFASSRKQARTNAVLQLKSLEAFAKAADGKATKIIIPSEIQGIAGLVKGLTEVGTDVQKAE